MTTAASARWAARAQAVGVTARRALSASGGRARVLARPGGAAFLTAAGEIVWLGPITAPLHPRAVLVAAVPDVAIDTELTIDATAVRAWAPTAIPLDSDGVSRLRAGWRELVRDLAALGIPAGFGVLLADAPLAFPLDGAAVHARALARACARDEATAATPAALALLGLGGGLTPSGDDFVGGMLFARQLLAAAGRAEPERWRRLADAVKQAATTCTHPISAALLSDLASGSGHAPLHEMVTALAAGDLPRARRAAATLARLGHSSGWDMLAGVDAGLGNG